jgi:hypothetical protein
MISAFDMPRPPPAATCSNGLATRITLHNCIRSTTTITILAIIAVHFSAAIANNLHVIFLNNYSPHCGKF